MSDDESVAEKIVELGIEMVNPGGRPDVLRAAAAAWREMGTRLAGHNDALDREVGRVVGSAWTGPAADGFLGRWRDLHGAVDAFLPDLEAIAANLEEAADAIEDINDQIHRLYVEIGVGIAVGVGLSFITAGFAGAAAAARAAQLAARAARLAKTLGAILSRIAKALRTIKELSARHRVIKNFLVNWSSNTGGSVIAQTVTTGEVDLLKAVWQGGASAAVGTPVSLVIGSKTGGLGKLTTGVLSNAGGSMAGGLAADGLTHLTPTPDDDVSGRDMGINMLFNGLGGAAGGAANHGAYSHINQDGFKAPAPNFSVDGVLNGGAYGLGGSGAGLLENELNERAQPGSAAPPPQDHSTRIRNALEPGV